MDDTVMLPTFVHLLHVANYCTSIKNYRPGDYSGIAQRTCQFSGQAA